MSLRWPWYLPVNQCCNNTCNPCTTPCGDPCVADPCHTYDSMSDHLAYTGANLPYTGINTCDTLTVAFQKIEEKMCILLSYHTTTTTTTVVT